MNKYFSFALVISGIFLKMALIVIVKKTDMSMWICYFILFPLKWILSLDFEAIISIHVQKQLYMFM